MKYTIIGAGMMGSAVAYDLATYNPGDEIILADINLERATRAAKTISTNVHPVRLDVNRRDDLLHTIRGSAVVVSAVSYSVNYQITKAAIETGVCMCDLGGNNNVVEQQLTLDEEAKAGNVVIIPNCGLAPGLINVLAMDGLKHFDSVDSIRLRVGGLPQHPRPPLNYQIAFSVEGLINEYLEKATVIREGKLLQVDSMSDLEDIAFPDPFGALEAFSTSGGISLLAHLLDGKVRNLDYKTIRYKGHCEKFRTLLELGFATDEPLLVGTSIRTTREFFEDLLRKKLTLGDTDVVLGRATISGSKGAAPRTLAYNFIDYYDERTMMTAMMRGTAFPTSITASMLAQGTITARGVVVPEVCVPGDLMIHELAKRHFTITKQETEAWR